MQIRAIDPLREDASRFGVVFAFLIALLAVVGLSGCNTIGGAGEDIGAAGEAMSDTAEDVEEDM